MKTQITYKHAQILILVNKCVCWEGMDVPLFKTNAGYIMFIEEL